MERLNSVGLLPEQAQDSTLTDRELAIQITDENPELMMYLRIQAKGLKEPVEIPGARELYETMTMYQWIEALEAEVNGR